MKFYVLYDKKQDRVLAEIISSSKTFTLGAVDPKLDGNYVERVIISGLLKSTEFKMGLEKWWEVTLQDGMWEISDEFPFDPDDVKIVTLGEYNEQCNVDGYFKNAR